MEYKIYHRTRLASQSFYTCHLHGASCDVWQHVDTPSDKLKKIKSYCSCTPPLNELFGWAHTEIFTRLGQTTSLKKTYIVHWFGSEKMERDYIGHIYQIRYGVLKHMLEKLLDGIFHWASSIKVIFMEACRWRSAVWKWNQLGSKVLLTKPMQPRRADFHIAIADKFLGGWLQVASLAW